MGESVARALLSFDDAQALLSAAALPIGIETVPLARAGRRILAADVRAMIDAPRSNAAAMDGYAVRFADLNRGVRAFTVAGACFPGETLTGTVGEGAAIRIMTGAHLPPGFDRVLPMEIVNAGQDSVELAGDVPARTHVRPAASDLRAGTIVLHRGQPVDPKAMVVAAASDLATLSVYKRPRVFVVATGDELVAPGNAGPVDGRIPDSLSDALLLLARQWGAKPAGSVRVGDDASAIGNAVSAARGSSDVLVIAGGASRGDRDFARSALQWLELDVKFSGLAIKPGKPAWYGRIGEIHVLGLPGNPTAAMTVARLFLAPLLTALGGQDYGSGLRWRTGQLAHPLVKGIEREQFLAGRWDDGALTVFDCQDASAQLALIDANALIRIAPHAPARDRESDASFVGF